jgi:hypothetical protein
MSLGVKGLKKRYEGLADAEEDISSYWMKFKKREDTGN